MIYLNYALEINETLMYFESYGNEISACRLKRIEEQIDENKIIIKFKMACKKNNQDEALMSR